MVQTNFCVYKQFACSSAKATGKRAENNLLLEKFGIAVIVLAIFAYFYHKTYFSAPNNQVEKPDCPFRLA
jgi:hypothetical protein